MKPRSQASRRSGFTLIELLTVVTVIVILAAVTMISISWIPRMVATKRAQVQERLLDAAMVRYHADTGVYPVAVDGSGMAMYCVLFGDGVGPDGIRGTADDGPLDGRRDVGAKTYMPELDPVADPLGMVEGPVGGPPTRGVDPFGNSRHKGGGRENFPRMNNRDFDIHSPGADGGGTPLNPGADDIHNW